MPQIVEPSDCFFKKGHLKSSSQQAPHRLQSPRRSARASIISCLRKLVLIKRRIFPWACRARSLASPTLRERNLSASRSSNERCLATAAARRDLIRKFCSSERSDQCGCKTYRRKSNDTRQVLKRERRAVPLMVTPRRRLEITPWLRQ